MIRILDARDAQSLREAGVAPATVAPAVAAIIADVRARGDLAVRELTARFDGPTLDDPFLDDATWDALAAQCPAGVRAALETAAARSSGSVRQRTVPPLSSDCV